MEGMEPGSSHIYTTEATTKAKQTNQTKYSNKLREWGQILLHGGLPGT